MKQKIVLTCLTMIMLNLQAAQPPVTHQNDLAQAVAVAISTLETIAQKKQDEKEKKELLDIAHHLKESIKNTKVHTCPCPAGSSWH